MAAPSYLLTNYTGTTDPAGDIITLIEARLTAAGWVFVEEYAFTQSATSRLMRVWKNPSTLNVAVVDFYIAFCKNAVAGVYLAMRAFEGWDAVGKTIQRPCIKGNATQVPAAVPQWLQRSMPSASSWTSVAYGNSTFVAIASASTIAATSPDGITWTARTLPVSTTWQFITYGNSTFVAIAGGAGATTIAATSPDGITWTQRVLPSSATWQSVTYGGSTFVAVANGGTVAATSPDGITWTLRTLPAVTAWQSVTYGNGTFVVIAGGASNLAVAATSPDGITWTQRVLPSSATWQSVAYGNSTFVAIAGGVSFTTISATSPDGITWTARVLPASVTWKSIIYGNNIFVAITTSNLAAATSPDGITWTSGNLPTSTTWLSVAYGNNIFVAVSSTVNLATMASALPLSILYSGGEGTWLPTGATSPAMVDTVPTTALIASTNYDVGVLASKSYVVIGVNTNNTTTQVFSWVLGLYSPTWTDAQSTTPPLMALDLRAAFASASCGVSRSPRVASGTNAFDIAAGLETKPLGTFVSGVKEPVSQTVRLSRVALAAGSQMINGFTSSGAFRGLLYDAAAVNTASSTTTKIGDTVTIGATVYTSLGQSLSPANMTSAGTCAFLFNTAAGS